ncbi:MAG: hypothetical protein K6F10_04460 [Paludibacteraceae bacterium]|nr:hypothetical protein [Paludibacteraceae bacterium]
MKCSSACPFYSEAGEIRGINGPLQTHCRMTMNPWMIDCDIYNPMCIEKLEVTEEQWKAMQKAIGKKAKKERKPYDPNHEDIHTVGCDWTRGKGKWNSLKSSNVKN